MSVQALLDRLAKAKPTGRGTWVACCPAHEDRNPSMTVRELDDGRVLLHCFVGCEVREVLDAVGLDFDALFPEKPIERAPPLRRPFPAGDVLEALAHESKVVLIAARDLANGKALDEASILRVATAAGRIEQGRALANG